MRCEKPAEIFFALAEGTRSFSFCSSPFRFPFSLFPISPFPFWETANRPVKNKKRATREFALLPLSQRVNLLYNLQCALHYVNCKLPIHRELGSNIAHCPILEILQFPIFESI